MSQGTVKPSNTPYRSVVSMAQSLLGPQHTLPSHPQKSRKNRILAMVPVQPMHLPADAPLQGVYLLSEGETHLYVGRSDRIPARIREHCLGGEEKAAFAFKLAR